ncbi:MAG: hypothetical protein H0T45_00375 [Pyrinomonadaceae bacterium]|nr:hypothetical protein [Pyrinomonadaceae bacterium]
MQSSKNYLLDGSGLVKRLTNKSGQPRWGRRSRRLGTLLPPAGLFAILLSCSIGLAQERGGDAGREQFAPAVTVSTADARVRFAAPNGVVRLGLEVLSADGQTLFEATTKGSVFDWTLQDARGELLPAGSYLCVLTVKDPAGRITQRLGVVEVTAEGRATVRPAEAAQLTAAQAEAVGPVAGDTSLSVVAAGEVGASTVLAHDGVDGQLTRTGGALSFRVGDFFAGKDKEQMRLTEDGLLGIGTDKPEATLDVAGMVRSSKGYQFADGTTLSSESGRLTLRDAQGEVTPAPAAPLTGVDEIVFSTPGQFTYPRDIRLSDNFGGLRFYGADSLTTSPAGAAIQFFGNNAAPFNGQLFLDSGALNTAALIFRTATTGGTITERMRVTATGNVGIGTTSPETKLDIQGSVTSDNGVALKLYNASASNFNRWYLGTGGAIVAADAFSIGDTSNYKMTILSSGNVGLGTTTPQAKLDVRGDIRLGPSGQYRAASGEENLRILRGVVNTNGASFGVGFFSEQNPQDPTKFTVYFNTPFASPPTVTATLDDQGGAATATEVFVDGVTSSSVNFKLRTRYTCSACNPARGPFHFIAIGPR